MKFLSMLTVFLFVLSSSIAEAAPGNMRNSGIKRGKKAAYLAKNSKRRQRVRILKSERRIKKDTTKIDFAGDDIYGGRHVPSIDNISVGQADLNYDFVKIRLRWHPEMKQSAASLNAI